VSTQLRPHYSGARSRQFWNRINALPERLSLYETACLLQMAEAYVLLWLRVNEQAATVRRQPRRRAKR
jgi:hypothetical protein